MDDDDTTRWPLGQQGGEADALRPQALASGKRAVSLNLPEAAAAHAAAVGLARAPAPAPLRSSRSAVWPDGDGAGVQVELPRAGGRGRGMHTPSSSHRRAGAGVDPLPAALLPTRSSTGPTTTPTSLPDDDDDDDGERDDRDDAGASLAAAVAVLALPPAGSLPRIAVVDASDADLVPPAPSAAQSISPPPVLLAPADYAEGGLARAGSLSNLSGAWSSGGRSEGSDAGGGLAVVRPTDKLLASLSAGGQSSGSDSAGAAGAGHRASDALFGASMRGAGSGEGTDHEDDGSGGVGGAPFVPPPFALDASDAHPLAESLLIQPLAAGDPTQQERPPAGPKVVGQYVMGAVIGEGSYGKVREGFCSVTLRYAQADLLLTLAVFTHEGPYWVARGRGYACVCGVGVGIGMGLGLGAGGWRSRS
jgi:hypothetical protein